MVKLISIIWLKELSLLGLILWLSWPFFFLFLLDLDILSDIGSGHCLVVLFMVGVWILVGFVCFVA